MRQAALYTCVALALAACARAAPPEASTTSTTSAEIEAPEARAPAVATFLEDDPAFTRSIETRIARDRALSLAAANVNVTTRGSIVTLSGSVADHATLDALKATVEGAPGVSRVYYDIQVWPLHDPDQRASDENIAFSLQRSLIHEPRVTIDVVCGGVTLRGEAMSSSDTVVETVTTTPGVAAVIDELTEPPLDSTLVQ